MAKRPKGRASGKPVWVVGPIGPIMASIYWRPWGRSGKLMWCRRKGRELLPGIVVIREWEDMMAKRVEADGLPALSLLSAGRGSWAKLCPELASWLCDGQYEDGQVKGEVTVTLRRNVTTVLATLKVEDGGVCLKGNGDTPDDALVALELLLTAQKIPWEHDPWPLGKRGKKK
jgi:hypothetical protein